MHPSTLIRTLEANAARISTWLSAIQADVQRWKPAPTRWSMLEVIGHLCDEERDDFRARLKLILASTAPWPPIDPEAWVTANGWQSKDPASAVKEWTTERQTSLTWLRSLTDPDWTRTYDHPEVGKITAADLLASWTAHDLLHEAQLARLHAEQFVKNAAPLSTSYAAP